MDLRIRSIGPWPGERTKRPKRATFGAAWSTTVKELERELALVGSKSAILEIEVDDRDLRNDGWIRSNARPRGSACVLNFQSKFGHLRYPCDTFDDWQANVRAIVLTLNYQRRLDRYGVTKRGEQYTGFKGLPPPTTGSVNNGTAPYAEARRVCNASGNGQDSVRLLQSRDTFNDARKRAMFNTHPDRNPEGDRLFPETKRDIDTIEAWFESGGKL